MSRRSGPVLRGVAGVLLAFVSFLLLRAFLGFAAGVAAAAVAGVLGGLFLPRIALVRICWSVPLFALLLFVAVQMLWHVPGDPFASERNASDQVRQAQKDHYEITEKNFWGGCVFFASYVRNVVRDGYLGPSIKVQGRTVGDLLAAALPVSVSLGLMALILAVAIGLVLGIRSGLRPNTWVDYGSMGFATIGISLPSFVIGALLMLLLALDHPFSWLPVAGWGTYRHLLMPALALSLPYAAYIARLARAGTIEVMTEDFVRTARAKGLSERAVVLKHALRGAILPVVTYLGPAAAGILMGSFVIETMFDVPGMGQWFVKSAVNRDYYVVLGTVFIDCGIVLVFNLLVDMAYAWLDPRLRGKS